MKAILIGIAIAAVIGVVAGLVLPMAQVPAFQAYATDSVRVGNPGENLIGPELDEAAEDQERH
ncbi:hypothetical protein H9Q09_08610 [Aurantimonas sp. DM33-3]|uniref:hypothetical protein n=1 Tax=Aurantimonas sp. DM33-3 TaxID=2766955 RepID=UPI0016521A42|nr:hypothetical protein [Aurantimonas sp. DM33-3]MBC6716261.1 hypothetical protein [Aurantimonas sp. DM33-3]